MKEDQLSGIYTQKYRFDYNERMKGKRIAIYGAGAVGKSFYYQISWTDQCEITAWVDKQRYGIWNLIPIEKPEVLKDISYDVLLIAVKCKAGADEIKQELRQNGICKSGSDVLWEEPVYIWQK